MKKTVVNTLALILSAIILACSLCGCGESADKCNLPHISEVEIDESLININISEETFSNDVYALYQDTAQYLGKTIRIQGMSETEYLDGKTYHYCYRFCPSIEGNNEAQIGLEYMFTEYPPDGAWIDVVGILDHYEENGYQFLTIKAVSVALLDTPGRQVVSSADIRIEVSASDLPDGMLEAQVPAM